MIKYTQLMTYFRNEIKLNLSLKLNYGKDNYHCSYSFNV